MLLDFIPFDFSLFDIIESFRWRKLSFSVSICSTSFLIKITRTKKLPFEHLLLCSYCSYYAPICCKHNGIQAINGVSLDFMFDEIVLHMSSIKRRTFDFWFISIKSRQVFQLRVTKRFINWFEYLYDFGIFRYFY